MDKVILEEPFIFASGVRVRVQFGACPLKAMFCIGINDMLLDAIFIELEQVRAPSSVTLTLKPVTAMSSFVI